MWSHRITNAYVGKPTHGLAVPNLMWMSAHFDTSLQMPILAVSYGTSSMSLSCRVQEIWSHKITKAYRTMKHGLLQGLDHSSNCAIVMGMSQYLNTFL